MRLCNCYQQDRSLALAYPTDPSPWPPHPGSLAPTSVSLSSTQRGQMLLLVEAPRIPGTAAPPTCNLGVFYLEVTENPGQTGLSQRGEA